MSVASIFSFGLESLKFQIVVEGDICVLSYWNWKWVTLFVSCDVIDKKFVQPWISVLDSCRWSTIIKNTAFFSVKFRRWNSADIAVSKVNRKTCQQNSCSYSLRWSLIHMFMEVGAIRNRYGRCWLDVQNARWIVGITTVDVWTRKYPICRRFVRVRMERLRILHVLI